MTDAVKQQVAAHWNRRAATFDEDFGHSIRTPAERAAWDRILDLVVPPGPLDTLDVGCGTGFLSFEVAARGHRVTGIDFAPAMIAEARQKADARRAPEPGTRTIRFEEGDAESLRFASQTFDLVISRHLLWTLAHPEAAIDEWIRVLRPGGRLVVVDGQFDAAAPPAPAGGARASAEHAAIGDHLPFLGGRSREQIEALLAARGLVGVDSDPLFDLVAAQEQRMVDEGRERRTHRRYVVWGDLAR
ncbi:MAG: methyltransferase domain-containing protein [Candidatus Rokubacteria bacterium]|nr:methyltransferase domain-containing protein [Candidatus Rokubacteria bacterium]